MTRIKITLHAEHVFDETDDWGFPDAYEDGGVEGVKELIREDVYAFLEDLGPMDSIVSVEVTP